MGTVRILRSISPYSIEKLAGCSLSQVFVSGKPLGYFDGDRLVENVEMLGVLRAGDASEVAAIASRSFGGFAWVRETDQAIEVVISPSHPGIFWHFDPVDGKIVLSDDFATLARQTNNEELDPMETLRFIPGIINGSCFKTMFAQIRRIPGNISAKIYPDGSAEKSLLPDSPRLGKSIKEYFHEYFGLLSKFSNQILVYSSGGVDSAALLSSVADSGVDCFVVNGDESSYRQEVSQRILETVKGVSSKIVDVGDLEGLRLLDLRDDKNLNLSQALTRSRLDTLVKTNYFRTEYKIKTADIRAVRSGHRFDTLINGYGADEVLLGEKTGPDLSSIYSGTGSFYIKNAMRGSPFSFLGLWRQYLRISSRIVISGLRKENSLQDIVALEVVKQFCFFGKTSGSMGRGENRRLLEHYLLDDARALALWIVEQVLSERAWSIRTYVNIVRKFVYFHVTHIHVLRYASHAQRENAVFEFPYLQAAILNDRAETLPALADVWRPKGELYRHYRDNIGESYRSSLRRAKAKVGLDEAGLKLRRSIFGKSRLAGILRRLPGVRRFGRLLIARVRPSAKEGLSQSKESPTEVTGICPSLTKAYGNLSSIASLPLCSSNKVPKELSILFHKMGGGVSILGEKVYVQYELDMNQRELLNWMHVNVLLDSCRRETPAEGNSVGPGNKGLKE